MEFAFPQYRKLEGFNRYYKIISDRSFEEVSVMNSIVNRTIILAQQYPELLRIQDMLLENWSFRPMNEEEIHTYFPD